MFFLQFLVLTLVGLSIAQDNTDTEGLDSDRLECGPCDKSACPTDLSCPRGTVSDPCSCCQVCAKVRGERCGGPNAVDGRCADEYICAGESVYEPVRDGRIGQCVCKSFEQVCGTDGKVYKDECELEMANSERVTKGQAALKVDETDKLCLTVPVITVPPKGRRLQPNSQSELSCEASGRPIPDIIWTKDGEELPGNHINIATRKRNGPTKFAMTSWVLINVTPDDAGAYKCTAVNSQGEASATANILIAEIEAPVEEHEANQVALEL